MLGMAVMVLVSAITAWTVPDSVPGTVADGAQMIVFLQGMAFNVICLVYLAVQVWRNRQLLRSAWKAVRQ